MNGGDVFILERGEGGSRAVVSARCGGTVHELSLVPRGRSDLAPARGAHLPAIPVLAGEHTPVSAATADTGCETELFRGRLLIPWNDRIPSATYTFRGTEHRLRPNTPGGEAIHGFLYRHPMMIARRHAAGKCATLTLRKRFTPEDEPGYPFTLDVTAKYTLRTWSFSMAIRIENCTDEPAPVTAGWHPYFTLPGAELVDELTLQLSAPQIVPVGPDLLPTGGPVPVPRPELDWRQARQVGPLELDLAYHTRGRDDSGRGRDARHTTTLSDGRYRLLVRQSRMFDYVQLFIPPNRRSIAVEPVSAATNAFNVPELGLTVLKPGAAISGSVMIALCGA